MSLTFFTIVWCVLATVVFVLLGYRKLVATKEDDQLHIEHGSALVSQQQAVAVRLETIDRWGKTLTVITLACGLALASAYLYLGWQESQNYLAK